MSEFSSSFHIRTKSAAKTERNLWQAKMAGLVFGPANGWLTFVPYPGCPGLPDGEDPVGSAQVLAAATGEAVLYFQFAEDHGWSLALVQQPEGSPATFSCAWDREPPVLHDDFDRSMLKGIVATSDVEPFLVNVGPGDGGTPKAHGFAERLGLPAYRWLSPDYVEKNTQHFIDDGARKLGRKAAKTATTKLPPPTRIALPKPALTAREALELLTSTIKWVRPPWTLRSISGNSEQVWHFTYYNAGRREGVQGYFHSNGSAGFQSLGHDPPEISAEDLAEWRENPDYADLVKQIEADIAAPPLPTALPDQWLDSSQALAIARSIERPGELGAGALYYHLTLQWHPGPVACWDVGASADYTVSRVRWSVRLDAQTGKILREVMSKPGEGRESWEIRPWRERIDGGPWQDI